MKWRHKILPIAKNFRLILIFVARDDAKLMPGEVCQVSCRYSNKWRSYSGKTEGGSDPTPPPPPGGGELTSKKVYARATATVLNRIFSSFQNLIRPLVPTIYISRVFDISMTWGQVKVLTSPLWVNGGNIEILPNASVRCNSFRIMCS